MCLLLIFFAACLRRTKTHALRLQSTGEGVAPPPTAGNGEVDEFSDCYIGGEGPDATTTPYMKNIWGKLPLACIKFDLSIT